MDHANDAVPYHGTLKGYLVGFVLALILTAIPFAMVMNGKLDQSTVLWGIFLAALVQIIVHLHFFLHLDASAKERWSVMSLTFTGLIMTIFIGGTVWIMYNMHLRMMVDSKTPVMESPASTSMATPIQHQP